MSRTPEIIVDKTKKIIRSCFVGFGIFSWFMAFGNYQYEDKLGVSLIWLGIGAVLFWMAAKMKVVWQKDAEIARYR